MAVMSNITQIPTINL